MALKKVNEAKEDARLAEEANKKAEAAYLKVEELQLEEAGEAARLANEGSLEQARQIFVRLISDTSNIRVLSLAHSFFNQTGDLDCALIVLERWLVLSGEDEKSSDTASAYGNLGNLYQTKGDLDRAEAMYEKSLALFESLCSPNAEKIRRLLRDIQD